MNQPIVTLQISTVQTKLLVVDGQDEILRAVMPAPKPGQRARAASALLEGLALWLGHPLHVVVSADEMDGSWCLGLTDDVGLPQRSAFYTVEMAEKRARRRGRRLGGVGDFRSLKPMLLVPTDGR